MNNMLTKASVFKRLREKMRYLETEYGVKSIGLFGSIRAGTQMSHSDIDLVVDFERPIGLQFVELAEFLEQLLETPVDLLTPMGIESIRNPAIADSIKNSIEYV